MNPYEKLVDEVMKHPRGPQRWRAAVNLWLKLNPKDAESGLHAREEHRLICKDNIAEREDNLNRFATSSDKNSGLRRTLRMPAGAMYYIQLVDPEAITKKNMAKMHKEFAEYRIAEAY